jgi:hypothetical protein
MSTNGLTTWAVDLKDIGAIYPFQGWEVLMVILGFIFWIGSYPDAPGNRRDPSRYGGRPHRRRNQGCDRPLFLGFKNKCNQARKVKSAWGA